MINGNSEESKSFFRELKSKIQKDQLLFIIKKYQKIISIILIALILFSIFYTCWSWYQKNQSKKYSIILHQSLIDDQNGNTKKSTLALKQIYQSSASTKVKQIASLRYAISLTKDGKNEQAIEVYLNINKNKKFDQYVREYAGLIALKTLVSSSKINDKEKILSLGNKLEKDSKFLKYQIIEQKGLLLWNLREFKGANETFKTIVNNPEASDQIKQRAKEMIDMYGNQKT
jgi:hypothetical protein